MPKRQQCTICGSKRDAKFMNPNLPIAVCYRSVSYFGSYEYVHSKSDVNPHSTRVHKCTLIYLRRLEAQSKEIINDYNYYIKQLGLSDYTI